MNTIAFNFLNKFLTAHPEEIKSIILSHLNPESEEYKLFHNYIIKEQSDLIYKIILERFHDSLPFIINRIMKRIIASKIINDNGESEFTVSSILKFDIIGDVSITDRFTVKL